MSARYLSDGSCEFSDFDGETTAWPTPTEWAEAWLDEWRRSEHGPACEFIDDMIQETIDGVVAILAVLAERAAPIPDELDWVGAGPLEDLLSHSGNAATVLNEVEQTARHHSAFKTALSSVWLRREDDPDVRTRLIALGARAPRG